ncbi:MULTISPECIES: HesA/MoeB/ThiF family protein [unclassified Enterobacter]|uniref:HesA/MoeB/ThiF family protein n=1 Tax=unclassified Enterobacter TaxID=2608935 RepID=UPI0015CB7CA9|nr:MULTISPECIES: HesA/MoeB/ThiF family protein [unclassified Enterobacter]MBB3307000.1 molybdopterin/thiamine biosynthesis adenylyltransferase/rhodanese-related sulfurtransferase [Enterobacter sp. Sphag1F]NYI15676.1 molybdopterin/thiamine biosynthesis adenylyltransferase/rhodanese-related sulfurtransferase [Enterobacter sp. Sphag71]
MQRYQRQMMLPEIGEAGQQKLLDARVLVAGAGGLAATLLPQLVGAGVGHIRLYDDDVVALHNLHRQTLFTEQDIDQPKVLRAQQALQQRNPQVQIEAVQQSLSASNVQQALAGCDLVIDAADNFAVTYQLSDACMKAGIPLISASVLGRQGYVGGFCGGSPSYRAVFPRLPSSAANCNTAGVMGPAVATLGAMQAQMALSVLLELQPSPLGCLVNCDFVNWHFRQFRFDDAEEPEHVVPFIDPQQLAADDCIVELRSCEEAPVSVTDGVERILPQAIAAWQPPAQQRIVLVCASGIRAAQAASALAQRGFHRLAILAANRP